MVWFHTGVRCKDDMVFILVRCNDGMVFILVWRCKGMVLITCVMQRWYGFHTREALRRYGFYYSCHAEMVWFWYSCHPEMVWFSYSWRVWFDWATYGDLRGCVILRWYGLKTRDMLVWFGWLVRRSLLVAKLVRRNHTLFWLSWKFNSYRCPLLLVKNFPFEHNFEIFSLPFSPEKFHS